MITYRPTDNDYKCTGYVYHNFVSAQVNKIKQPKLFH